MLFASNGRVAAYFAAKGFRHWIFHLGALGFIPLGLLDSSVVPVPGSMDVLTILLSARERNLWPYYALMATIGSVVGGLRQSDNRRPGIRAIPILWSNPFVVSC